MEDFNTWVDLVPDTPFSKRRKKKRSKTSHSLSAKGRRKLRERLINRDGLVCRWCGRTLSEKVDGNHHAYPTIDHLLEVAKGGSNRLDNCVLACRDCNNKRSNGRWEA